MKFFAAATTALLLSAQALAELTSYKLYAKSDSAEVDGKGVSILHEGAGINYVFLGTDSIDVTYDDAQKLLYVPVNSNVQFNLGTNADIIQFSVTTPVSVEIAEDGSVNFEGSDDLFAAQYINDPYNYSKDSYAVILRGKPHAIPIKLVAKKN
ncbi:hypothetical LDG family protein, putative [Candida dubliniensis CD36]|uniref:Hypothetical LDG family protein, putative n=1 Tax=Candida dubliniensis (strain CD36 / ATCC MYA-646 / CBS 7987 / NCPF 3949 / NRRL Y-17841) TaxID=573826 RepID=B9WCU5_CANDC|nr:hypothetical LDG family protein, putative [Candida dubliniensis CD36]CAX44219.1 hypothetical LDG family protein, putative [Candida dubliniensis CD36]